MAIALRPQICDVTSPYVYVDEQLSMGDNARHCAKTSFYHLRRIRQLRCHINYDTLYTLWSCRAWITVTVYLFAVHSQSTHRRLQRVQDAAARLLCDAAPRSHVSPLRQRLHWLPVSSQIQFELCTLMFDIQHGTAAQYLAELCDRCDETRLRSAAARGDFVVRQTRLRVKDKAFSVARPRAWNALPADIIKLTDSRLTFRRKLKTYLFKLNC